jgi:hypothetical protein
MGVDICRDAVQLVERIPPAPSTSSATGDEGSVDIEEHKRWSGHGISPRGGSRRAEDPETVFKTVAFVRCPVLGSIEGVNMGKGATG